MNLPELVNYLEVNDSDFPLSEDEDEIFEYLHDSTLGLKSGELVAEDKPVEFLDERFSDDQELRLSENKG
jgi:hypothetical protein